MRFPFFPSTFKHKSINRGKNVQASSKCNYRLVHASLEASVTSHSPLVNLGLANFENLGLHPPIVAALRRAFPNVCRPTDAQTDFIPAILNSKDVLLRDLTGSGKSFGLMIALLNKPRFLKSGKPEELHHTTSLVIVPHRDLAYQYLHWIQRIVTCADIESPQPNSVAQVLVRDGGTHLTTGINNLYETPPHILVGTPQAVMDVWHKDSQALQLSRLSTIVVDEVDYLVETLPKKDPARSFRPAIVEATKRLLMHPGLTRELLDIVYTKRKRLDKERKDEPGLMQQKRRVGLEGLTPLPQLILCSATLRGHLRTYLFKESGWLNKDNLLVYKGTSSTLTPQDLESTAQRDQGGCGVSKNTKINVIGGTGVSHSVIIIYKEKITNIEGALAYQPRTSEISRDNPVIPEVIFGSGSDPEVPNLDEKLVEKYAKTSSPFNPNALEAIATAFALDVPSIALLVLPASAPVVRAVYELREMGVNAHTLDLLKDENGKKYLLQSASAIQENPTLLVCTLATTRGIDLPELSHVFILGIPERPKVSARAVDAYLHIAGRVGRFGRDGRVISVVEGTGENGEDGVGDEASKMGRILKTIGVRPVRFEPFD
ncbi:hypothetical protein APHAL10511_006139 [Amanita phalloides]|nr:hypothetical protein APHAL10511_006139 [Amanita phalloides]